MTVTERVQSPGVWSLDLSPETPRWLRASLDPQVAGFRQLVVTPGPVDVAGMADADVLALARYSGIYRTMQGLTLSGAGVSILLEDEDGKGDIYGAPVSYSSASLSTVVSAQATRVGLTAAAVESRTAYTATHNLVTPRKVLDAACAALGSEWRVRPDMKLTAGTTSYLYGTTPTLVVLSDDEGGRDLDVIGVRGTVTPSSDVEDFATLVVYIPGRGNPSVVPTRSTTYRRPDGNAVKLGPVIDANDTDGTAPNLATAELGKLVGRRSWDVSTLADVGALVTVGAPVWLWDPDSGLLDSATQVYFRGRSIFPATSRLMGLTWPITADMGVYLRHKPDTSTAATYTDLTPYVEPESGSSRLELGAVPRRA